MFKDIPGFNGYLISKAGIVKSQRGRKPKTLSPYITNYGYEQVSLCRDDFPPLKIFVHRLVLLTFVGEPPFEKAETRHLNGNRLDNNLSNLKYGTGKENMQDAIRHGTTTRGEKDAMSKLTTKDVLEIVKLLGNGCSHRAISDIYGVSRETITHINLGTTWNHLTGRLKNK